MARPDPHSYCDDRQPETESFAWSAAVDFATRTLTGAVELALRGPSTGAIDLDTRDLTIDAVLDGAGEPLPYQLHPAEPILGSRLAIELTRPTRTIRIRYRTSPDASALQWLAPAQTAAGRQPFLFSQCQAIHARSVIPLQDTPRLRVRYTAQLTVPRALRAVMAAASVDRIERGELAIERFAMPQPIPPYLLAFAVGDLVSRELSPRSRVWAEPPVVERAAYEFAEVEGTIAAAEQLFGAYDWDRFDILTMPPSFPYGGMENPRLTFITPTVLAGDRSLVDVIAHELAHSWTGNLVTNANAEHFWLNEGFTVYAERRIVEATRGRPAAELADAIGWRGLADAIARFTREQRPELTKLRTQLAGVDPDDAFSLVPYEKGYFFLCALEREVGRPQFDRWLRSYLSDFRFGAITTDDFVAHFERALPGVLARVNATAWLDGEAVSDGARPASSQLATAAIDAATTGVVPARDVGWNPAQWQLYLESIPRPASLELCESLDRQFLLTKSTNYEVLVNWLVVALSAGYDPVLPRVREVIGEVGRLKYLRPLYQELVRRPATRDHAREQLAALGARYHPITRQVLGRVVASPTV